jgi:RNA polymerase sigma-70 factor (ECF subfamily)
VGVDQRFESTCATEADERIPLLQQVIASLPSLDRALLLLYLDDHSYREIAAIIGITETNVATKLSRLKQTIRNHITRLTEP